MAWFPGQRIIRRLGGLAGPIIQGAAGLSSVRNQNNLQTQHSADVDQQIADMLGIAGQVGPETLAAYDAGSGQQLGQLQKLLQFAGRRGTEYLNTARQTGQDRYNWAKQNLEGYGRQQRADLQRSFDEALATNLAGMQERGIGSTTAVGSQRNLNRELLGAEQRRLGEDLTRMRQDVLGGIQRENQANTLNAMQYRNTGQSSALGNLANFYGQQAANRSNMIGSGYGTFLNTLGSINYAPPGSNQAPGQIAANLVDSPDPANANSSAAPWIAGGSAAAGAGILALASSDRELKDIVGEVDGEQIVQTLKTLPVYRYHWKPETGQQGGQHVGPTAQDFWSAFRMGDHEKIINLADAVGILTAAVKTLIARIEDLENS